MHDQTSAEHWRDRIAETLRTRGITAPPGTPGVSRVRVPWRLDWAFELRDAEPADVGAAVQAARDALREWRLDAAPRRRALTELADALAAEEELLTHLICFENGKLQRSAAMEVGAAIGSLRHHAGLDIPEEVLRDDASGRLRLVREPVGVVAAVTPANMPLLMLVNKLAAALLTGNTVIAKPSPQTPLSALMLQSLSRPLLPPGVFRVLPGGAELGRTLVAHPGVGMITLTGSRRAGREVMAAASATITRLQLELGGNDPAILLDDADVERVAPEIFRSAFASSGQACVAVKRVYAPPGVLGALTERLVELANAARVGSPYDPEASHPVLSGEDQYRRVLGLLAGAEREGATIRTGGAEAVPGFLGVRPAVVTGPDPDGELVQEEQFGPVLPLVPYEDLDALVDAVNAGPYGLGATIWTANQAAGERLARRLDVGMTWVNRTPVPDPGMPFGGMRESGLGREGGRAGLDAYCELKTIGTAGADHD
ncbi:aldehyde dehydrogenase family protein [Leucobacter massiliensis]|uniref:aldehyde dehydrogenase family protein n=1 Tax=Leucobacter massiliensis TaxID=1686285 RepID=UPI0015E3F1B0|nr:aldehyde dehydrogenase family protein [Leucobacter massiliensis]